MSDLISRQAVINALEKEKPTPFVNEDGSIDPFGAGRQKQWYRDGIAIMNLPSAQPTVEAIPVEWIYKWLENIPNNWRGYADDWNYNIESEVKKIVYKNNTVILLPCITDMLDDWMEENK